MTDLNGYSSLAVGPLPLSIPEEIVQKINQGPEKIANYQQGIYLNPNQEVTLWHAWYMFSSENSSQDKEKYYFGIRGNSYDLATPYQYDKIANYFKLFNGKDTRFNEYRGWYK